MERTNNDITAIMSAWRDAISQEWIPLQVAELVSGDTVYGHIEEAEPVAGLVSRVVMYGQPFTIESIDDEFWRTGDNPRDRRRMFSSDLPWNETNLDATARVIVVKGKQD